MILQVLKDISIDCIYIVKKHVCYTVKTGSGRFSQPRILSFPN